MKIDDAIIDKVLNNEASVEEAVFQLAGCKHTIEQ